MIKKDILPQYGKTAGSLILKRLEDAFDVNYAVSEIRIDTMDEFNRRLYNPFVNGNTVYYRGERINSRSRRLVPTFLRGEEFLPQNGGERVVSIDSATLFDYYCKNEAFLSVYKTVYGEPEIEKMYDMTAFAQHYLDISPFIDFSKSLFVAVSFAVKGRKKADADMVIYTAFDIGFDDTTTDINEVNRWLKNYNVKIINTEIPESLDSLKLKKPSFLSGDIKPDIKKIEKAFNGLLPSAKLIDIPTNDLMKYQQGVFLLLNDFSIVNKNYLTKAVRQSFVIEKYIINKDLCTELNEFISDNAPQYRYECLMNISKAVKGITRVD